VIQYGFQPLMGLNATFDEDVFKGQLTASLRWSNNKSYNLTSANRATISSQTTNEITAQANYAVDGFEFPLFGLSLQNQLEYSFLFTYKGNRRATYNVLEPETYEGDNNEGTTLDGNTQIIVEPRVRYALSNIVTASLFLRYEGTFTEGASQPGYHTTQFGLDIRISITGGR
jgi:cell surface protein SprA